MFMKGIKIAATVVISNYNVNSKYGAEHDGNFTWDVGLVQILESSLMKAVYGTDDVLGRERMVYEWKQNTLPCYDCEPLHLPFYDAQSHAQVTGDGQFQFILSDIPGLIVNLYTQQWFPGYTAPRQPLVYAIKENTFNVYCVLRARYKAGQHVNKLKAHRLLKHCKWTNKLVMEPNENWQGANRYTSAGYKQVDYSISSSWIYNVTTTPSLALPDYSAGTANENQNHQGREQNHWLPIGYAWK
jgi:hypothetical protein